MSAKKSTSPLLLIGGGADAADVRHAAGFTAPDPFLFLSQGGERVVVVSALELGRALRTEPELRCLTPEELKLSGAARRDLGKQAAGLLAMRGLKSVRVSRNCPVGVVRELERAGVRVSVRRAAYSAERLRKGAEEVEALRGSQRAAANAMRAAMGVIRESEIGEGDGLWLEGERLSSERVRFEIEVSLLRANMQAEEIIVAGGDQAVDPHERGSGPLRAGEPIVLDIFPRSKATGYWGDMTRTVVRGKPTSERRRLYRTVKDAQEEALERVRPGVSGAEIHAGICRRFEEAGYKTGRVDGIPQGFIHSTGHGVGLDIHEGPSVGPMGGALEEGQVVTIEPGLYYRGMGGVRIEDTVVVTADGASLLAKCTKVFAL